MCQYLVFYGEYENEKKTGQKKLTFPVGIWSSNFWTCFCSQFEFWGTLDQWIFCDFGIIRMEIGNAPSNFISTHCGWRVVFIIDFGQKAFLKCLLNTWSCVGELESGVRLRPSTTLATLNGSLVEGWLFSLVVPRIWFVGRPSSSLAFLQWCVVSSAHLSLVSW